MTGTGTQTDPYVVDNWNDFKTSAAIQGAYVKFADGGGTINILEAVPGRKMYATIIRAYVDGNGWNIKNANVENVAALRIYGTISNLNFIDFYVVCTNQSTRLMVFYANAPGEPTGSIRQCKFSGIVSGKYNNNIFAAMIENTGNSPYQEVISQCSFNVKINGGISLNQGSNIVCSNCIFDIDSSENQTIYPFYGINFRNCLVKGKYWGLKFPTGFSRNVVLDVECPSSKIISCANSGELFIGNSDKASYDNSIRSVTASQLRDADYLSSLGLPIGSGEITAITVSDFERGGLNISTGVETSFTSFVRSNWIPINSTAITVECNNFCMMTWNFICKDENGTHIKTQYTTSTMVNCSGVTVDLSRYPQISDVRIHLSRADNASVLLPQECTLYNGFTWKIDSDQNDGLPFPVLAPELKDFGAFANATELVEVSIPKSVKKIGKESFKNTKLKRVTIASDCTYYPTTFPKDCVIKFYPD